MCSVLCIVCDVWCIMWYWAIVCSTVLWHQSVNSCVNSGYDNILIVTNFCHSTGSEYLQYLVISWVPSKCLIEFHYITGTWTKRRYYGTSRSGMIRSRSTPTQEASSCLSTHTKCSTSMDSTLSRNTRDKSSAHCHRECILTDRFVINRELDNK